MQNTFMYVVEVFSSGVKMYFSQNSNVHRNYNPIAMCCMKFRKFSEFWWIIFEWVMYIGVWLKLFGEHLAQMGILWEDRKLVDVKLISLRTQNAKFNLNCHTFLE